MLKEEIVGCDETWEQHGAWAAKRTATPLRGRGKSVTDLGEKKRFIFACVKCGVEH